MGFYGINCYRVVFYQPNTWDMYATFLRWLDNEFGLRGGNVSDRYLFIHYVYFLHNYSLL